MITGASGLVGSYFLRQALREYESVAVTVHKSLPEGGQTWPIDLRYPDLILTKLEEYDPDIIVNLAALTEVDKCEEQRDYALLLNCGVASTLAKFVISRPDAYLLHISTDYVFDGYIGNYLEQDVTNPINWYGVTKLRAEREILSKIKLESACILRTSTPFGFHKKKTSFVQYVVESLNTGKNVRIFSDQITSPTSCSNLSSMMMDVIRRRVNGIIHAAGNSSMSRFDQALKIAEQFSLDKDLISPIKMDEMNFKAKRPRNSSLNVSKASRLLSIRPLTYSDALKEFYLEDSLNSQ